MPGQANKIPEIALAGNGEKSLSFKTKASCVPIADRVDEAVLLSKSTLLAKPPVTKISLQGLIAKSVIVPVPVMLEVNTDMKFPEASVL